MKTSYLLMLWIALASQASLSNCHGQSPTNSLVPFAFGLNTPVCISHCGDERLFITEQTGYIKIVDTDGNIYSQPFLDIHEQVTYGGEQGLVGLAFHPQFNVNGYFYVNYTGTEDSTIISRFSVSEDNPDLADPESEYKLMAIYQPYTNHNGGCLQFGPDGYLYIGLGDGGSAGDPQNRAQDPKEMLGKMLRIDVNNGTPYGIPASNPYFGSTFTLNEIWALGLRNPWRFSFDRLTGDLWIGDVGQNEIEEIDFQPANSTGGENYGWRCFEGHKPYNLAGCDEATAYSFPVHTYLHGGECSVTGGYVYRGNPASPFFGDYFFADYCSDRIWTLQFDGSGWISEEFGQFQGNNFSTFGENAAGQLFVAGLSSGTVYRIDDNATGLNDNNPSDQFRILQNPSSTHLVIESLSADTFIKTIEIMDLNGKILLKKAFSETVFELDAGRLSPGLYLLRIVADGRIFIRKIYIQGR